MRVLIDGDGGRSKNEQNEWGLFQFQLLWFLQIFVLYAFVCLFVSVCVCMMLEANKILNVLGQFLEEVTLGKFQRLQVGEHGNITKEHLCY